MVWLLGGGGSTSGLVPVVEEFPDVHVMKYVSGRVALHSDDHPRKLMDRGEPFSSVKRKSPASFRPEYSRLTRPDCGAVVGSHEISASTPSVTRQIFREEPLNCLMSAAPKLIARAHCFAH